MIAEYLFVNLFYRYFLFDQPADRRYSKLIPTEGKDYSPAACLQYWADLLRAGVRPDAVHAIGIDGGKIAGFEYRLALALGAQVGVLDPATRMAATLRQDPDWAADANLFALPKDTMAVRAFAASPRAALSADRVETAARTIHEDYLKQNHYKNPDAAMQPWPDLREDFKDSNRAQAHGAAAFLERIGYRVEPAPGDIVPPELNPAEVEQLAEMEHGRWVVERLAGGWRYGKERDTAKRLTPFLVPWCQLDEAGKERDRKPVRGWPALLAAAGLKVSK